MILCYIDESGVSSVPGNTSHFVLAGLTIPVWHWKTCESEINPIKKKYGLEHAEIHTGWILRKYFEQSKIPDFENLSSFERQSEAEKYRRSELLRLQKLHNPNKYRQAKKNFKQTNPYIHLTHKERIQFIEEIAKTIGEWGFARLFAECIDKVHFNPRLARNTVDGQAFEQLVSRIEYYLRTAKLTDVPQESIYGILIHDNNDTVAREHTKLMNVFHESGTLWTDIERIIETPLFVNSQLTSMIQIVDVCAYALRRYLENKEEALFNHIFKRADARSGTTVGVRHFTNENCTCKICVSHKQNS